MPALPSRSAAGLILRGGLALLVGAAGGWVAGLLRAPKVTGPGPGPGPGPGAGAGR